MKCEFEYQQLRKDIPVNDYPAMCLMVVWCMTQTTKGQASIPVWQCAYKVTDKELSFKYMGLVRCQLWVLNQFNARPDISNQFLRRRRSIEWSTVSKIGDKSKEYKCCHLSTIKFSIMMPLWRARSADSVWREWRPEKGIFVNEMTGEFACRAWPTVKGFYV